MGTQPARSDRNHGLTERDLVALALALGSLMMMPSPRAQADREHLLPPADQWQVLEFTTWFNDAGTMVTDDLIRAARAAEARAVALRGAARTPDKQRERAKQVRERVLDMLGGLPGPTPLNARVTGGFERETYRVENVCYDSLPGLTVSGNLYVPKGRPFPAPAVLCPCGHSGKERPVYQSLGIALASNGFVALVTDSPDRGERAAPGNDHFRVGALTYLTGANSERYFTLDVLRGLDYLESRPEVNRDRLGCTGVSGGAVSTLYASALDERIKCAVPVCGVIPLRPLIECLYTTCPEQLQHDTLGQGVDEMDVAGLIAPRPLLLLQGHRDDLFYVPDFLWGCEQIAGIYRVLGVRDRVDWEVFDSPHDYSAEMREAACRWLGRWIGDAYTTAREPEEIRLAEPSELVCAPSPKRTIQDENVQVARGLAEARQSRKRLGKEELRRGARRLLGLSGRAPRVAVVPTGVMRGDGLSVEKLVLRPEPGVQLPVWVLRPDGSEGPLPVLVKVREDGGRAELGGDGVLAQLARGGHMVVAVDVRGVGETSMRPTRWDIHGFCSVERIAAWGSFVVSRPLVGMRVSDVLAAARYATGRPDAEAGRLALWGSGAAAVWTLYAALLHGAPSALVLEDGPLSYHDMALDQDYTWPDTLLLPNVLRHHDLPEVLAALASRPVLVLHPRGARREALSAAAATEVLGRASASGTLPEGLRLETGDCDVAQFLRAGL